MKYKLSQGRHQGPGVRNEPDNFEKGDVVESDEPLDELFPNKFKKVGEKTPVSCSKPGGVVKKAVKPVDPVEEDSGETEELPENLGADCTDDFEGAKEADMLVFKMGKKYNVAEAAFPAVATNEVPLTKKQVISLIKKDTPEEDDEDE